VTSARDIMTTEIVSVGADTPTQEIARLLLDKGISAVPVIDCSGAPIGMVSEGDLIGRNVADPEARRDWWLALLAEGEPLSPEFLDQLRRMGRTARDVMAAPVVTVEEQTGVSEIARMLAAYRIKRVRSCAMGALLASSAAPTCCVPWLPPKPARRARQRRDATLASLAGSIAVSVTTAA
jgi:CBS domain-containing protein